MGDPASPHSLLLVLLDLPCSGQAEEDRRWVNAHQRFVAKQAEVMKNVSQPSTPVFVLPGCVVASWAGDSWLVQRRPHSCVCAAWLHGCIVGG